jgi:hypothetical protein
METLLSPLTTLWSLFSMFELLLTDFAVSYLQKKARFSSSKLPSQRLPETARKEAADDWLTGFLSGRAKVGLPRRVMCRSPDRVHDDCDRHTKYL